jgi:hypothetical protein
LHFDAIFNAKQKLDLERFFMILDQASVNSPWPSLRSIQKQSQTTPPPKYNQFDLVNSPMTNGTTSMSASSFMQTNTPTKIP